MKRILLGTLVDEAANRGSLADPRALDYFALLAASRARTTEDRSTLTARAS